MTGLGRSFAEILAFAALLALSVSLFCYRLRRIARIILASRPEPGFHFAPVGPRIGRLVVEVLCQAKVIRHRPLVGVAHALVFWGFCAFALVTINHLLLGFGVRWLDARSGGFARGYFFVAAVFAIAAAVAIAGLALRRFVFRPKWLGTKSSPGSGLIAVLIFTLMATYLADYALVPSGASMAGRTLWWAHTLALLVFLPLIPHTKHLHLLLGPVSVFLSRGGFSRIPPLEGDEDIGLVAGGDVTQILALQAYSCVECGRCQQHCPAYNTGKLLNPKEIALGLRSYLNTNGALAEAPLLGVHLQQEAIFQCTTCGACEHQCPVGVEHLPLIVGLRRGVVNSDAWKDDYGRKLFLKLEQNGNPLGMPQSDRDKFIQKAGLPLFDGTQEYLLWLGCMGAYDPRGREIICALVRVLRHLEISFGVLKREKCSGDAARRLGNDLAFQELAEFNLGQLKAAKARKLLSICPHCVRTIGEDWKEFGAEIEIEHHSVLLARVEARLPAATVRESVVYHDPCYLGRYQGVYDEPRQVISASSELIEPPRSRDTSFCCGAGGGLTFLGEERGTRVSHERARELAGSGAQAIAAACPFCHSMLGDALRTIRPEADLPLIDIAELAARRLPAQAEPAASAPG